MKKPKITRKQYEGMKRDIDNEYQYHLNILKLLYNRYKDAGEREGE